MKINWKKLFKKSSPTVNSVLLKITNEAIVNENYEIYYIKNGVIYEAKIVYINPQAFLILVSNSDYVPFVPSKDCEYLSFLAYGTLWSYNRKDLE